MVSMQCFQENFNAMADVLKFGPKTELGRMTFFERIERLTDERFEQVCIAALDELEEFPAPAWLLNRAKEVAHREDMQRPAISAAPEDYSPCPADIMARIKRDLAIINSRDLKTRYGKSEEF